jgi:SAM-dependent methyltransferase
VPPSTLWLGYAKTAAEYLATGRRRVERLKAMLAASGFALGAGGRVLDFGCASAIMLRWFDDVARDGEAWGVDIDGSAILWCQQHLSPPFRFVTTTTFPHLPFDDGWFDLVYAASVFTHIADLADAWLLELRRILRPGGRLFVTVHDRRFVDAVLGGADGASAELAAAVRAFADRTRLRTRGWSMFAINRIPGHGARGQAQVFYDADVLARRWGNYLRVLAIVPERSGARRRAC